MVNKLYINIVVIKFCLNTVSFGSMWIDIIIIIVAEAHAWARKYFTADCVSFLRDEAIIKGINDIKFNSRPIQIRSQLFDDIDTSVPSNSVEVNRKMCGIEDIIKDERS